MTRQRAERDALTRMRAAMLDLTQAQRFTEANALLNIIERIEPSLRDEAAGSAASPVLGPDRSDLGAIVPPVASGPATYLVDMSVDAVACANCRRPLAQHCTTHLLPCCPGSLMHGQDEGTWTPSATDL